MGRAGRGTGLVRGGAQSGLTLLELLVALAVAAVALSLGVPSYTTFVQNSRQMQSANELLATLHFARDTAITRNVQVTMCPSTNGSSCAATSWASGWIAFVDADGDRAVGAAERVERVGEDLGDLAVATADFPNFLVYRPSGRVMANVVTENSGEFTLCDERGAEHARVVIIEISGRPRVSDTRADGSAPVCA